MLIAIFHLASAVVESLVGRPEGGKEAAAAFRAVKIVTADFLHPGTADPVTVRLENRAHLKQHFQLDT